MLTEKESSIQPRWAHAPPQWVEQRWRPATAWAQWPRCSGSWYTFRLVHFYQLRTCRAEIQVLDMYGFTFTGIPETGCTDICAIASFRHVRILNVSTCLNLLYLCMRRSRINYFYTYRYLCRAHIFCFICAGCVISIFLAPPLAKWRRPLTPPMLKKYIALWVVIL